MISFRSEAYGEISLPPEVSFETAFSRLDPLRNSFYILSLDEESYMQCGGGPSACTVEVRIAEAGGTHCRYVIGHTGGLMTLVRITMSQGGLWVGQREVLTSHDAVQLFACFLAGEALPARYALRDPMTDPVVAPPEDPGVKDVADDPESTDAADDEEVPALRWLAATDPDNRFDIDGYDCAAYVGSRTSMTANSNIARSFAERRTSIGTEFDKLLPEDAIAMDCTLVYAMPVPLAEGAVFRARKMEDKWDTYRNGERLAICRSWTGSLVFVGELVLGTETLTVRRFWVGAELADTDAGLALRQFDYLLRSHVLGRLAPHPLPADLPDQA